MQSMIQIQQTTATAFQSELHQIWHLISRLTRNRRLTAHPEANVTSTCGSSIADQVFGHSVYTLLTDYRRASSCRALPIRGRATNQVFTLPVADRHYALIQDAVCGSGLPYECHKISTRTQKTVFALCGLPEQDAIRYEQMMSTAFLSN